MKAKNDMKIKRGPKGGKKSAKAGDLSVKLGGKNMLGALPVGGASKSKGPKAANKKATHAKKKK